MPPSRRPHDAPSHTWSVPIPPPVRKARFDVRPWGDGPNPARELLPYVDNVSLVDLISGYERAAGYDVPSTYAGIVLDHFNFGDLTAYLAGEPHSAYWAKEARSHSSAATAARWDAGLWKPECLLTAAWSRGAASLSLSARSATTGPSAPSCSDGASTSAQAARLLPSRQFSRNTGRRCTVDALGLTSTRCTHLPPTARGRRRSRHRV
jgi:hypothetical protein